MSDSTTIPSEHHRTAFCVVRAVRIELLLLEYSVEYLIEYSSTRQGK